jgi:myo-inositol-1(or 4)-monophosphatase
MPVVRNWSRNRLTESPSRSEISGISDAELKRIEDAIVRAASEAGAFVASRFGGMLEISNKGDIPGKDVVTDVDKASQRLIAEIMAETCPDHMLLGEEDPPDEEPAAADWLWIVDPIDGTTNFVNSSPVHAVSIAALFRGEPVAAAIWIPWPNEAGFLLMHARKGGGSWIGESQVRVHKSSDSGEPITGVLVARPGWIRRMFNVQKPLEGHFGEIRVGGSACYEQFLVANGTMQYAITGFAKSWDFAAAILLVKEAGGKVLALDSTRQFSEFGGWSRNYANDSATYGRLRKWGGLLLTGAPDTVDFVAANLRPKRRGWVGKITSLVGS